MDLLETNLTSWEGKPIIWAESRKLALKKALKKGLITFDDAINRLKWDSAANKRDMLNYGEKIKNIQVLKPKHFDRDNDYQDIRKNRRNFLSLLGFGII